MISRDTVFYLTVLIERDNKVLPLKCAGIAIKYYLRLLPINIQSGTFQGDVKFRVCKRRPVWQFAFKWTLLNGIFLRWQQHFATVYKMIIARSPQVRIRCSSDWLLTCWWSDRREYPRSALTPEANQNQHFSYGAQSACVMNQTNLEHLVKESQLHKKGFQ